MSIIKEFTGKFEKICRGNRALFKVYAIPYRKAVSREIELGDIGSDDVVLNIGCGALPFTAYFIASLSGADVIAVDSDEDVLNSARRCLADFAGGSGHCSVDVRALSGSRAIEKFDFDAVMAALQTENKLSLLQILARERKDEEWKFMVREPRHTVEGQYDTLSASIEPQDEAEQYFPTFDRTVLYTSPGFYEAGGG